MKNALIALVVLVGLAVIAGVIAIILAREHPAVAAEFDNRAPRAAVAAPAAQDEVVFPSIDREQNRGSGN